MSNAQSYMPVPAAGAVTAVPDTARPALSAHRMVIAAFIVLTLLAAGARLLTFERFLPYLDYSDESVRFVIARSWRGLETNEFVEWRYDGYPPIYVWINIGVQQLVEATRTRPWTVPPDYFYALRLLSAITGVVTALVVVGIGWQLAGALAGWAAGFIWALAPIIVEHNSLAIPDPFVYLTCAAALFAGLRGWRAESPRWLLVSLVLGILSIYLKLWPIHALIPWGIVTLVLLRRSPRRMLPWVVIYALVGLAAAAYLFLDIRPLSDLPSRELQTFNSTGVGFMLTPDRNFNNWYFAIYPVGHVLFYGTLALGAAAYVYSRRQGWRTLKVSEMGLLLLYSAAGIFMASSFTNVWLGAGKIRHVLPVTVSLLPVWGAALAQVVWALREVVQRHRPALSARVLAPGAVGIVLMFTLPSFVPGNIELVQRFQQTDMRVVLWRWADVNVPTDGLILADARSTIAHTWNRFWSGYDGAKPFEWWFESGEQMAASSPQDYADRGIAYFVMNEEDRVEIFNTPELQAFIDRLTPVKTLPAAPGILGDTVYFYRILPPQQSADAVFGEQIVLTGYDLSASTVVPGGELRFRPYWNAAHQPDTNYSMFVHVYAAGEGRQIIAQQDGAPTVIDRPTLTWSDPGELYIGADVVLSLPPDTAPGDYLLAVGLYDYVTGQRLTLPDGSDFYGIPITVTE